MTNRDIVGLDDRIFDDLEGFSHTNSLKGLHRVIAIGNDERDTDTINISSKGERNYRLFSPFMYSREYRIPVPGQKQMFSDSVEGIWQGLKVIDGVTDFSSLFGRPQKRKKGNYMGHLYGEKIVDIVNARKLIYEPAFEYYLENIVPEEMNERIMGILVERDMKVCDTENSLDPENPDKPLAHSYYFAEHYNEMFTGKCVQIFRQMMDAFETKQFEYETLAEPLSLFFDKHLSSYSDLERMMAAHVIESIKCSDEYMQRYFSRIADKLSAS